MKLGLLSNERQHRGVNWTTLSDPLFEAMERLTPATRICPNHATASEISSLPALIAAGSQCDALFAMHGRVRPDPMFLAISQASRNVVRSIFYVDPWKPVLKKIALADRMFRHQLVFLPYREAFEELRRIPGGERYRYIPYAADTEVFRDRGLDRDIDILWMGRRCAPLHEAILAFAQNSGLVYRFRENTGVLNDPEELGTLVSRARYFVVTPPDEERSGGFSPLVMRYLEGLASGCRLVGTLPLSGEFEAILPRESILEVSDDGSDFAAKFGADQLDRSGWDATAHASRIVRKKHGWDSRAATIIAEVGRLLENRGSR